MNDPGRVEPSSIIRYCAAIGLPCLVLTHPDGFDEFDQLLKQGLPVVLGFDKMARPRLQTLAQARVTDDFESRVGESFGRIGDHQLFAVNDAQSGDGFRGSSEELS